MEIRPLTDTDAEAIATWRYPGRYATYDVGEIVTPERGFWAVEHEADLFASAALQDRGPCIRECKCFHAVMPDQDSEAPLALGVLAGKARPPGRLHLREPSLHVATISP